MSEQINPTQNQEQEVRNDKEYNFAQMRKQLEAERIARQQAEERIAQFERASQNKQPSNDDEDDDDEPYVDRKKLNKTLSKFEKSMDEKIDQRAEMKARTLVEEERKNSYLKENSDFNQIMASDVVQRFADKHPRLAENILRMPEGFERQKLVYENIKALGIDKPEMKQPSIQDKIDQNKKSPYYQPSSVGTAPYHSAGNFSEQGKKDSYQHLQELKKRFAGG